MDDRYGAIKKLIAENSDIAEFGDFGDGVSDEWIKKAESFLGISFPQSYKWWLKNYSGGEIGGEEIFSIYEQDFEAVVGGDIVYMHKLNQKNRILKPNQLVICESDTDGAFYFNVDEKDSNDEYPVYSAITGKIYAKDFLSFLEKRILAFKAS
jgi:hypothetical protein